MFKPACRVSLLPTPPRQILKGLTLDIPAGTMAALVGESGSGALALCPLTLPAPPAYARDDIAGAHVCSPAGKSTVIQLVLRFYDPVSGSVYLDGFDLRSLRLSWLRSHVGIVAQEPQLFSATLRENILYGREGADDDAVRRAATQANVLDFIEGLPGGLDTEVGERGVQLSGTCRSSRRVPRPWQLRASGLSSDCVSRPAPPRGRRAAPAHRDRPGDAPRAPRDPARRGHLGARQRVGEGGAGGARGAHGRPHDDRCRAPAQLHPPRGHHRRCGARVPPRKGARHGAAARPACGRMASPEPGDGAGTPA